MTDSLIALALGAGMLVVWWRMSETRARQVASQWFPNRSLAEGLSFAQLRNRAPAAPVAPVELRPLVPVERELAFAA